MPKLSILMPVYNSEITIKDTILSIVNQNHKDYEILIIDDYSNDNTINIIQEIKSNKIRVLKSNRKGLVNALNTGIDYCDCEYIIRMDSDDISRQERLSVQEEILDKNKNIITVGSNIEFFCGSEGLSNYPITNKQCKDFLLTSPCFAHPTVAIRRATLSKYNIKYKNEYQYAEDYKLWCDLAEYGSFINISKPLLSYRVHKNQISTKKNIIQRNIHTRISHENLLSIGVNTSFDDLYKILWSDNGNAVEILNLYFLLLKRGRISTYNHKFLLKKLLNLF